MEYFRGQITEIRVNGNGETQAIIHAQDKNIPSPGQYLQAWNPADSDSPLPISLFPSGYFDDRAFLSAPPFPSKWKPGDELQLRGPLGRGFSHGLTVTRLGLISLDDSPDRLMAFADLVLNKNIEVALFSDTLPPKISTQIEVNPLSIANQAFKWADSVAIDTRPTSIEDILKKIGISPGESFPCPTEILINIPMPCAGIAKCGVCTLSDGKNKSLLTCEDGPVFSLTSQGLKISR
mgnify:FL=1